MCAPGAGRTLNFEHWGRNRGIHIEITYFMGLVILAIVILNQYFYLQVVNSGWVLPYVFINAIIVNTMMNDKTHCCIRHTRYVHGLHVHVSDAGFCTAYQQTTA